MHSEDCWRADITCLISAAITELAVATLSGVTEQSTHDVAYEQHYPPVRIGLYKWLHQDSERV